MEAVLRDVRKINAREVPIHCVGMSPDQAGERFLRNLAELNHGEFFQLDSGDGQNRSSSAEAVRGARRTMTIGSQLRKLEALQHEEAIREAHWRSEQGCAQRLLRCQEELGYSLKEATRPRPSRARAARTGGGFTYSPGASEADGGGERSDFLEASPVPSEKAARGSGQRRPQGRDSAASGGPLQLSLAMPGMAAVAAPSSHRPAAPPRRSASSSRSTGGVPRNTAGRASERSRPSSARQTASKASSSGGCEGPPPPARLPVGAWRPKKAGDVGPSTVTNPWGEVPSVSSQHSAPPSGRPARAASASRLASSSIGGSSPAKKGASKKRRPAASAHGGGGSSSSSGGLQRSASAGPAAQRQRPVEAAATTSPGRLLDALQEVVVLAAAAPQQPPPPSSARSRAPPPLPPPVETEAEAQPRLERRWSF